MMWKYKVFVLQIYWICACVTYRVLSIINKYMCKILDCKKYNLLVWLPTDFYCTVSIYGRTFPFYPDFWTRIWCKGIIFLKKYYLRSIHMHALVPYLTGTGTILSIWTFYYAWTFVRYRTASIYSSSSNLIYGLEVSRFTNCFTTDTSSNFIFHKKIKKIYFLFVYEWIFSMYVSTMIQ